MSHVPVLLKEVIRIVDPKPDEFIIDGTMNGGGYAREVLNQLDGKGTFLGVDWDEGVIAEANERIGNEARGTKVILKNENFARIPELLESESLGLANGLVLDLGFSSDQIDMSGKGFSFQEFAYNEPLIMTYSEKEQPVGEILRDSTNEELEQIFRLYGEERYARRIAQAIKESKESIETVGSLVEVIKSAVPKNYERGRIHPATRTFMALRIHANRELENLETLLQALPHIMHPGGRVAVVSFHSLEDRIVKRTFQKFSRDGSFELITKNPITASVEESRQNPRSRSAKLRGAIKI